MTNLFFFCRLKINHVSNEFILEFGIVTNNSCYIFTSKFLKYKKKIFIKLLVGKFFVIIPPEFTESHQSSHKQLLKD
jgi:hypothetical protein